MSRLVLLALALAACSTVESAPVPPPFPPRPAAAPGGEEIARRIADMPLAEREELLVGEIERGNVPGHLRRWVPITVAATLDGAVHRATYWVLPDVLAVGSDTDFLRVPLSAEAAQQVADRLGCALPTRKIVDDVARAATVHVEPRPFHPERHDIRRVEVFVASNRAIERQRAGREGLVAGGKKEVVVSALLADRPGRVAIYGWHQRDGEPIQPLSAVHVSSYVDYSHGVRLVRRSARVDGQARDWPLLLADPVLWPLFSDEGPFGSWRYR